MKTEVVELIPDMENNGKIVGSILHVGRTMESGDTVLGEQWKGVWEFNTKMVEQWKKGGGTIRKVSCSLPYW